MALMSIPKITGQQARELLDIWSGDVEGLTFAQLGADRSYGDLFGAAPALAETVAWLYGYTSEVEPVDGTYFDRDGRDGTLADEHHYLRVDGDSEGVLVTTGPYGASVELTPDEAVDLARALLAAAEEARP